MRRSISCSKQSFVFFSAIVAVHLLANAAAADGSLSVRQAVQGCERRITVELEGSGPTAFTDAAVKALFEKERASANCSDLRSMVVKGYADDRLVYQAIARAPRWQLRSTPILSGADAIARATPERPDPAELPAWDGYSLSPIPERGSECAIRMYYNLNGPAPMTNDNERWLDALGALAGSAAEACPQLVSITLQLPKNSGSRVNFFTVSKNKAWLPPAVYANRSTANQKLYQAEYAAMKNRPLPGPDSANPLGDKGYFASRELARGIDFTLYEAWDQQRDYHDAGELVIVHDARPADGAIVPLRYDPARQVYQVAPVFGDELNAVIRDAEKRLITVGSFRHYMAGAKMPMAKIVNSSHAPQLELPLFTVSYELAKTAIYTVPQLGLPRGLKVVIGPSPSGAMYSRSMYEGDPRGADNVLTLAEVEATE